MRHRTGILGVLLLLLLVAVVEPRSRHSRHRSVRRQRDEEDRGGHRRHHPWRNGWADHWFRQFRKNRWGGQHALSFGRHLPFDLDFSWSFGHPEEQRPWWKGPHVCYNEKWSNNTEDENTIIHHFSTATQVCEEGNLAYKCSSTIQTAQGKHTKVELYECCHGFTRGDHDFGCPEKLEMLDLSKMAEKLELKDFLRAIALTSLANDLSQGNFTVFAPQNGAFSMDSGALDLGPGLTLQDQSLTLMASNAILNKMESELQTLLLGHLLPAPRRETSFQDEEVLETGSPIGSTIRINFYSRPEKLTTANCVRVTSADNVATNGVIHVVEKVLPSVTSSLVEIIQRDQQFSILKTVLARTNMVSILQKKGQHTLFAPTNAAFQRLDKGLLDRLLNGDSKCLQNVLNQHLLRDVICSTIIQGSVKSLNLLDNYLNLTRTQDNKLFVDDAQIVRADVMATNGVMHVIDAVLVPQDALDLLTVAKQNGLTEFASLIDKAQLTLTLQNASNITVFVPSNQAIQALPEALKKQLLSEPGLLQSVLNYHVVPEEVTCQDLHNALFLSTFNPPAKIRLNQYSSFPFGTKHVHTVQCVPISRRNVASCNAVIHIIDKVLIPPKGNVMDVLAVDSKYSTLIRLLKMSGLADKLQEEGPFTILAPTNKAFEKLSKETLQILEKNQEDLTQILNLHIIKGTLCCAGIYDSHWWMRQHVTTLGGVALPLSRDVNDHPIVGDATVDSCDMTATNGVVHSINEVILPSPPDPWSIFHSM